MLSILFKSHLNKIVSRCCSLGSALASTNNKTIRLQTRFEQLHVLAMAESGDVLTSVPTETERTSSPIDLRPQYKKTKKAKSRTKKNVWPNAFVSLPITSTEVKEKMKEIQRKMHENDQSIKPLMIEPAKFHLTLMVMHLDEESQLSDAQNALNESVSTIRSSLSTAVFKFDKISSFGRDVVFMTMSDEKSVQLFKSAAEKVREIFESHGLPPTDKRAPKPHTTLFKVAGNGKTQSKIPVETYNSIEDTNCGDEAFSTLQLCSMTKPKQPDGYYHVIDEKSLSGGADIPESSGEA